MHIDDYYTVEDIVTMLKVHEQTVRRWIREGQLPAVMLGRKAGYRIARADLERFLKRRRTVDDD